MVVAGGGGGGGGRRRKRCERKRRSASASASAPAEDGTESDVSLRKARPRWPSLGGLILETVTCSDQLHPSDRVYSGGPVDFSLGAFTLK